MALLIKICGITRPEDAAAAAAAGADALGVNLWPGSKRFVGDERAALAVLEAVPPGVLKVGVFVNAPPLEVATTAARLGLDRVQLHGDERPEDFAGVPGLDRPRLVRAVRVRDPGSFADDARWAAEVFLYDAFVDGYGGGGMTGPWDLIAARASRPLWLAGGLRPDNVGAAIRAVRPDGVDVASGVESAPGRKDAALMRAFVAAARAASTTP
ncbi:MAG TPA: phosphoribosylanthranilate isomerase [Polyangia bacterium]